MKRLIDPEKSHLVRLTALFPVLLFFVFGFFLIPHGVFAADPLTSVGVAAELGQQSLPILIARIIRAVLGVLGIVTVLLILYAGWTYMSAKGDPEKVKKAKKIITNAVIGLFIIFSSYSIASFILGKLLEAAYGSGTIVSVAKKYTEPLAGSLGAGILESHFPMRNATDVPRNTKIFVTFKEAIKPDTIIEDWVKDCTYVVSAPQNVSLCKTNLKIIDKNSGATAVKIFETAKGETTQLASDKVVVTVSDDHKTFVFKPVTYIGNPQKDSNYTVDLQPSIQKEDGGAAFTGANSKGYSWNFTVSTKVDLTPPTIVSIIPSVTPLQPPGGTVSESLARNISVEITFNEAMDPIATTGTYELNGGNTKNFERINVTDGTKYTADGTNNKKDDLILLNGTYNISNAYKTIGFTTTDKCGKDPCGGDIYCLPGGKTITVTAKAASIDDTNPPQGILTSVNYDGVVDAAGNSLDGNGDTKACGSSTDKVICAGTQTNDDYTWKFTTTNEINDKVPKIESLAPDIGEGNIDVSKDITLTFNTLLKASTVNSTNISLIPDPNTYAMWFVASKTDIPNTLPTDKPTKSVVHIAHPPFISNAEGGSGYWPVVTQDVKSAYQICMFPALGDATESAKNCNGSDLTKPYCCNGTPQATACPLPAKTQ